MYENSIPGLHISGTDTQRRQVLSHLHIEPLGEGDSICQTCGEAITTGDPVTLYLYRPAGHSGYTIGQCRCSGHNDTLTSLFTLGVREIIVDGRIGHYRSHDTDQTQSVLVAPSVRLISAPDTKSGRVVNDNNNHNNRTCPNNTGQNRITSQNSDTPDAIGCTQSALSYANQTDNTVTTEPPTAVRVDNE